MARANLRPFWLLPIGRINGRWWIPAVAALVSLDYVTGPEVSVPSVYSIPVALATWYSGRVVGLTVAAVLPASRLALALWVWPPGSLSLEGETITAVLRVCTFTLLVLLMFRLSEHERAIERDLSLLQGLLPLCAHCKRIRNADNEWEALESYVESRSGAEFSHGICPRCSHELHTRPR